jgi:hypothetical protein
MNSEDFSLSITIGPLRYRFIPHDAWGRDALDRISRHVACSPFVDSPDRIVHLFEFRLTRRDKDEMNDDCLPERLAGLLPADFPGSGWHPTGDETGHMTWCHDGTSHTLLTGNTMPILYQGPFQLPWQAMFMDITRRGGGVLHGGLAVRDGRGYLFTAPPGGGKTTALSRIPLPWRVRADDAALVWPDSAGAFRASPLPTWSVLLGVNSPLPAIGRWHVGDSWPIAGVILLEKAAHERISSLPPVAAAHHLYLALSEHPRVMTNRIPFRRLIFHNSCRLVREVPAWRLELTRDGEFWDVLRGGERHG